MKIPGVKTLRTFSRWLQARTLGGALILGYHRITTRPGAFPEICVSPENFSEQLHLLRKYTQPIHLSDLVQHLRDGSLPQNSIAVTFDDGYADNLYRAKPLLEKYQIPATFFICTGYAGKEFWWDELERLIACSRNDPQSLHLQIGEKQFQWHQASPISEAGQPEFRNEFRRKLYQFLLFLDPDHQNLAMDTIRSWSDAPSSDPASPRAMNHDEILQLANGGFVELGAHTRRHPMLPAISFERQREEIESSKRDLEGLLGRQIVGFAYPNGRADDNTRRIVRESGFTYACTSLHDVVRPGSDVYELTRFWQKNVDGDQFLQALRLWMKMSSASA